MDLKDMILASHFASGTGGGGGDLSNYYTKTQSNSRFALKGDSYTKLESDDKYAIKDDLGELADLETTDKSNIVAAINEVKQSGSGAGWTSAQITLLETVFANLKYVDDSTGQTAAAQLIASLRGGEPPAPEEPIEITYDGTTAVISGLNSLNIAYSGTTAEIGGE